MVQLLAHRFQPKVASASRSAARCRHVLRVVAFQTGDEQAATKQQQVAKAKVTFQLPMHVEWGQEVALVGAVDELGSWDVTQCLPMCWNDGDVWTAQAEVPTNTHIEYKYIIRIDNGEAKEVVEWQPCNNLELQAEQDELTIRDAWEGQKHDILEGTLPLPEPEVAPVAEEQVEEASPVAAEASAGPAAASGDVVDPAAPTAAIPVEKPSVPSSGGRHSPPPGPENAAAAVAKHAAPLVRSNSNGRHSFNGRGTNSRPSGKSSKIVAASVEEPAKQVSKAKPAAPAVHYGSLSTAELKEVCKEMGLSTKGQRKDLLLRLQQQA